MNKENLIKISRDAQKTAYSPYSKVKVGAALLATNGRGNSKVFEGCNIENISYGLTICAERVAAFKAVSEGFTKFEAIALSSSSENKIIYPCGACRQVLLEFNSKLRVYINKDEKSYRLDRLIPNSFTKEFLEK